MGSSDDYDERLEDINLTLVYCGIMSPIVVVTGFVTSKDDTGPNFTAMHNCLQFCNQLSKILSSQEPPLPQVVLTGDTIIMACLLISFWYP